jgi:transposase
MPTHSLDLRQRIVAAYQAGGTSIREVAKRFMVTKRTVHRLVQQYKQTQDLQSFMLLWDTNHRNERTKRCLHIP